MGARLANGKLRLRNEKLAVASDAPAAPDVPADDGVVSTLVGPLAGAVYQRVGTSKAVPVSGTVTGADGVIELRAVDAKTGAPITPWAAAATSAAGAFTGSHSVPQGYLYKLQARKAANSGVVTTGANQFSVGPRGALIGQSNMRFLSESVLNYPLVDWRGRRFKSNGTWDYCGAADPTGAIAPGTNALGTGGYAGNPNVVGTGDRGDGIAHFVNRFTAGAGLPIGTFEYAVTGSSIEQWQIGGNCWTPFAAAITAAGGDFEYVIWLQGENNTGTSMTTYKANLLNLLNNCRTLAGRNASNFHFGVVLLGPATTYYGAEGNGGLVRKAQLEFIAENANNGVFMAGSAHDTNLAGDGVHFNAVSQIRQGKVYALGLQRRLAGLPYGVEGPKITGATRSGSVITVVVQHSHGTALLDGAGGSGGALLGWRVFDNGAAATISATAISGNAVVLTLAAPPSGPVTLDYCMTNAPFGGTTAPASVVYDNDTVPGDTLGLPLQPCAAITVTGA